VLTFLAFDKATFSILILLFKVIFGIGATTISTSEVSYLLPIKNIILLEHYFIIKNEYKNKILIFVLFRLEVQLPFQLVVLQQFFQ